MNQIVNNVKTALFLGLLTALIVSLGAWFGGDQGMIIAFIIAGAMNFGSYFFSDKIALMSMKATEVGPEHPLYGIVERLAQRAGLPMPRVYVSPFPAPNAFATGRNPSHAAVCATQGLLDLLSSEQIAGVMSHELAHVKHRDILITTVAATMAGAITILLREVFWFGGFGGRSDRRDGGGNILIELALLLLAPFAAMLIQMAISRSREFNADSGGAEICGEPMWLASALQKLEMGNKAIPTDVSPAFNAMFISEPKNLRGSFVGLFRTHPKLEARLVNLIGRPNV